MEGLLSYVRFGAVLWMTLTVSAALADDQPRLQITDPAAQDRTFQTREGPVRVISFRESSSAGLVYLHGDQEPMKSAAEAEQLNEDMIKNVISYLKNLATLSHVSIYFVIRPGMFGELGRFSDKQSRSHYLALAETVHKIADEDNIRDLALVGQSGGAMAGLATLMLSPDSRIKCGIFQSGSYHSNIRTEFDRKIKLEDMKAEEYKPSVWAYRPVTEDIEQEYHLYDIATHIHDIQVEKSIKIELISDPRDQVAPFVSSELLTKKLLKMGLRAELIRASIPEPPHHKTMIQTFKIGIDCLKSLRR